MRLNPYLNFDGQCEAAFKFYERCLPGKIAFMMTYESRPGEYPVPPEWQKKILHATLLAGDQVLMGAAPPPDRYQKPQGFSLHHAGDLADHSVQLLQWSQRTNLFFNAIDVWLS